MAHTRFTAEVLTPEGEVFNDEVEMVSTRTTVGLIALLANHAPLLGRLEPTELRLYRSETDIVRFAQAEGYVQVANNRVLLLVEEAIDPKALDRRELQALLDEATSAEASADVGTEEAARAKRDKRRAEAFLGILEGP